MGSYMPATWYYQVVFQIMLKFCPLGTEIYLCIAFSETVHLVSQEYK